MVEESCGAEGIPLVHGFRQGEAAEAHHVEQSDPERRFKEQQTSPMADVIPASRRNARSHPTIEICSLSGYRRVNREK